APRRKPSTDPESTTGGSLRKSLRRRNFGGRRNIISSIWKSAAWRVATSSEKGNQGVPPNERPPVDISASPGVYHKERVFDLAASDFLTRGPWNKHAPAPEVPKATKASLPCTALH